MTIRSALIVHSDPALFTKFADVIRRFGFSPAHAASAVEGVQRFQEISPALVLVDLDLPNLSGRDLLEHVTSTTHVPAIAMTRSGNIRLAVEAVRAGAADVLDEHADMYEIEQAVKALVPAAVGPHHEVFGGTAMRAIEALVVRLAKLSTPVLIRGESGTGKGVVASMLHELSERFAQPFVTIAFAATPPERAESDLNALFASDAEATLFLDEIGEASDGAQQRALGLLSCARFRVLASTSADMHRLVASGRFRPELYERLAVGTIEVPPLRARQDEIESLVARFLDRYAREFHRPKPQVTEETAQLLMSYDWPGNVRELENVVKRWVVLVSEKEVRDELQARQAARRATSTPTDPSLREISRRAAREAQRVALEEALRRFGGNRAAVARHVKVSYKTLLLKLSEVGLAGVRNSVS